MIKIVRNTTEYMAYIYLGHRTIKIDLAVLPNNQKTALAHRLFKWRQGGYVGFPNLSF